MRIYLLTAFLSALGTNTLHVHRRRRHLHIEQVLSLPWRCDNGWAERRQEREQCEREDGKGGGVERDREQRCIDGITIRDLDLHTERADEVEDERDIHDHRDKVVGRGAVWREPDLQR